MDDQPTNDDATGDDQQPASDQPPAGTSIPINSGDDAGATPAETQEPPMATDDYQDANMADEGNPPEPMAEDAAPSQDVPAAAAPAEETVAETSSDTGWSAPDESSTITEGENVETDELVKDPETEESPIEEETQATTPPAEEPAEQEALDVPIKRPTPVSGDVSTGTSIDGFSAPAENEPVATAAVSLKPAPIAAVRPKKRGWLIWGAVLLAAIAAAAVYYFFFMASDMQKFENSNLALAYPKDWNYIDQGENGLAFYAGEEYVDADSIFLVFTNVSSLDSYDEMDEDQKGQIKANLIEFYTSKEFSDQIDGGQGNLEFSGGREVAQKGADLALSFDASGIDNDGRASQGILRVIISPDGKNYILLALAIEEQWVAHQNLYRDIADSLEIL